jgi:hypothetical protein
MALYLRNYIQKPPNTSAGAIREGGEGMRFSRNGTQPGKNPAADVVVFAEAAA